MKRRCLARLTVLMVLWAFLVNGAGLANQGMLRKVAFEESALSKEELKRQVNEAWGNAGFDIGSPASERTKAAFSKIIPLAEEQERHGPPTDPRTYFKMLYAELYGRGNHQRVIRFFEEKVKDLRDNNPDFYYQVTSNRFFWILYFIAKMMDERSVHEATFSNKSFFEYWVAGLGFDYNLDAVFGVLAPDRVLFLFDLRHFNVALISSLVDRKRYDEALSLIDHWLVLFSHERDYGRINDSGFQEAFGFFKILDVYVSCLKEGRPIRLSKDEIELVDRFFTNVKAMQIGELGSFTYNIEEFNERVADAWADVAEPGGAINFFGEKALVAYANICRLTDSLLVQQPPPYNVVNIEPNIAQLVLCSALFGRGDYRMVINYFSVVKGKEAGLLRHLLFEDDRNKRILGLLYFVACVMDDESIKRCKQEKKSFFDLFGDELGEEFYFENFIEMEQVAGRNFIFDIFNAVGGLINIYQATGNHKEALRVTKNLSWVLNNPYESYELPLPLGPQLMELQERLEQQQLREVMSAI